MPILYNKTHKYLQISNFIFPFKMISDYHKTCEVDGCHYFSIINQKHKYSCITFSGFNSHVF